MTQKQRQKIRHVNAVISCKHEGFFLSGILFGHILIFSLHRSVCSSAGHPHCHPFSCANCYSLKLSSKNRNAGGSSLAIQPEAHQGQQSSSQASSSQHQEVSIRAGNGTWDPGLLQLFPSHCRTPPPPGWGPGLPAARSRDERWQLPLLPDIAHSSVQPSEACESLNGSR